MLLVLHWFMIHSFPRPTLSPSAKTKRHRFLLWCPWGRHASKRSTTKAVLVRQRRLQKRGAMSLSVDGGCNDQHWRCFGFLFLPSFFFYLHVQSTFYTVLSNYDDEPSQWFCPCRGTMRAGTVSHSYLLGDQPAAAPAHFPLFSSLMTNYPAPKKKWKRRSASGVCSATLRFNHRRVKALGLLANQFLAVMRSPLGQPSMLIYSQFRVDRTLIWGNPKKKSRTESDNASRFALSPQAQLGLIEVNWRVHCHHYYNYEYLCFCVLIFFLSKVYNRFFNVSKIAAGTFLAKCGLLIHFSPSGLFYYGFKTVSLLRPRVNQL